MLGDRVDAYTCGFQFLQQRRGKPTARKSDTQVNPGGFATALAYVCWGDAALKISAGQTGIITACMPLSAMILSVLILKEKLHWYHLAGVIMVLGALALGCLKLSNKNQSPKIDPQ